jgi:hypothetical protein
VDDVEASLPEGLLSGSERWLLYFSLRSAEVELRDNDGRPVTPDDIVPEHRMARAQQESQSIEHHH